MIACASASPHGATHGNNKNLRKNLEKSGCSVRSSFVLGEFSSIEKKEIYIRISQCCKNQFALKK